jgi:hypothetical protein
MVWSFLIGVLLGVILTAYKYSCDNEKLRKKIKGVKDEEVPDNFTDLDNGLK